MLDEDSELRVLWRVAFHCGVDQGGIRRLNIECLSFNSDRRSSWAETFGTAKFTPDNDLRNDLRLESHCPDRVQFRAWPIVKL